VEGKGRGGTGRLGGEEIGQGEAGSSVASRRWHSATAWPPRRRPPGARKKTAMPLVGWACLLLRLGQGVRLVGPGQRGLGLVRFFFFCCNFLSVFFFCFMFCFELNSKALLINAQIFLIFLGDQ
jgi:hypothetical protein